MTDGTKNVVVIDFSSNPSLRDIFDGKEIGQTCEFTVKGKVKNIDAKQVVLGITKITSEYGHEDEEEKDAEPTPDEPIALQIGPKKELYPDVA